MNPTNNHAAMAAPATGPQRPGLQELLAVLAPRADDSVAPPAADRLVDRLLQASGADGAAIRLFDGDAERCRVVGAAGFPAVYLAQVAGKPLGMASRGLRRGGAPILVPDLLIDSRLGSKSQVDYGFASCAFLPLMGSNGARGVIHLASNRKGFFADSERDHWQVFASLASILWENYELRQAVDGAMLAAKQSQADLAQAYRQMIELAPLAKSVPARQVAQQLLDHLLPATASEAGAIQIVDQDKDVLALMAQCGLPADYFTSAASGTLTAASLRVLHSGQPVFTDRSSGESVASHELPTLAYFSSSAILPLVGHGELRGLVHLHSQRADAYGQDRREALTALAKFAAIMLENSRLLDASTEYAQELEAANGDLERFAYFASHDLQEPLRMIASFSQLLAKQYAPQLDATAQEYIGFAIDGAKRMQALIADLRTYSRLTTRGKPLMAVQSRRVLGEVLKELGGALADCGAKVTQDGLPMVRADDGQLAQLFRHLIGNAIKFRGSAPLTIHIGCQRRGAHWLFSLADNGIGIDRRFFDKIFFIFQRWHTRDLYQGSGVGLAICKRIVERHGGKIWVESVVGKGSTFLFTLLAARPVGDWAAPAKRSHEARPSMGSE